MYAIIQTGGKQYKVQPGDQLKVEKLEGDPGQEINFEQVLALQDENGLQLGNPLMSAAVSAKIIRTARDRKIIVFKKKRRHGYHKKQGHRQWFTLLQIMSVGEQKAPEPQETHAAPEAATE